MDKVLLFIGGIALVVVLIVLNGWVLSWLWLWFLVPLGLPLIGLTHSIGIAGTIGFMTRQYIKNSAPGEAIVYGIVAPFISLFAGYIVHSFM